MIDINDIVDALASARRHIEKVGHEKESQMFVIRKLDSQIEACRNHINARDEKKVLIYQTRINQDGKPETAVTWWDIEAIEYIMKSREGNTND